MSDAKKPDLTKSVVGRMLDAERAEFRGELEKLRAEQAQRDALQDAQLRPSAAHRVIGAAEKFDFTTAYPKTSMVVGVCFVALALWFLEGVKLYIGAGVGVCFVPGLAMKVVRLATGLKRANGGASSPSDKP